MDIKIKEIYRDTINVKDRNGGTREAQTVKIVPEEDSVTDINGDTIELKGRKVSGFQDKNKETDKWDVGMTIKVQIVTKKTIGKEGDEMEWVNFRLPEGKSSIVEEGNDEEDEIDF